METAARFQKDLINLMETELRLGLPGLDDLQPGKQKPLNSKNKKRSLADRDDDDCGSVNNSCISDAQESHHDIAPAAKQQVIGWPPVRNCRKNSFHQNKNENQKTGYYVKVSMDGAPYLRKIDLKVYRNYKELFMALENMFKFRMGENYYFVREGCDGLAYEPTYEDKDGDCMLVGDVPWDMFISSCKRLRIMRN